MCENVCVRLFVRESDHGREREIAGESAKDKAHTRTFACAKFKDEDRT